MEAQEKFVATAAIICEPVRARMLWNLLDGRAYTATELAIAADISPTAASNHLSKLLAAEIVKTEVQGRHRYFSFARPEVAYVVESLATLSNGEQKISDASKKEMPAVKFCRSCYDHLAGYVGVQVTEALEQNSYIKKSGALYTITNKGWNWFEDFGIVKDAIQNNRRPAARQCLDWSERRPHMAGQLGALMLKKMMQQNWFRNVKFSRELVLTSKGKAELEKKLGLLL